MREPHSPAAAPANPFLRGSIAAVFLRTSLPIILMTTVNGMLTVADGVLLGALAGPEALAAVTLVFPLSMLLVAASTIVGSGMASILGRCLGAGETAAAQRVFASAQGLAVALGIAALALFLLGGGALVAALSGGNRTLADLGWVFLAISFAAAPIMFVLNVQSDALRTEGRVAFMAIAGVLLTLGNIGLNGLLIGVFRLGVAGSALGTVLAQGLALLAILAYRKSGRAVLPVPGLRIERNWEDMLALGLPRSLSFVGISLGSAAVLFSLQRLNLADHDTVLTAYGVVMRVMTFAFLPLMGMSLGLQAIVGNTVGAGQPQRATATLRLALGVSAAYGLAVLLSLIAAGEGVGALFVNDAGIGQAVARILPIYVAAYFAFGPVMMAASYAQALGQARRAALLSLGRTYLFAIPLTLLLPLLWGEAGIWMAAPIADVTMLTLTGLFWAQARRAQAQRPAP